MNCVSLVLFHLLLACAIKFNDASVGCPGCIAPVSDPNADFIRKLMTDSLSQSNSGATLVNVKSCTSQTVAGVKYDCDVEVKSPSGQVKTCKIVATDTHWNVANPFTVISETCSQARKKRAGCTGCPEEQDPNEVKGKLKAILSQTNSDASIVKISKCTSQVVSGTKYSCDLLVESPRTNGAKPCQIEFWEQPWISKEPKILKNTCVELTRRRRK